MPAYDFRCTSCRHTFEMVRPASDASTPSCPVCGAHAKRVFTPVGIHFKGSGFHSTDYKKPATEAPEKATAEPTCPVAKDGGCDGCPAASAD